jgi:hypothetical protein
VSLTGDVEFTTSNRGAAKSVAILIHADATPRTFTFPAGWTFLKEAAPTGIAASKSAVLSLTCFSGADADIVAVYAEEF